MVTLKKRNFPMSELVLMASARSAGMKLDYDGKELEVVEATPEAFDGIDIALFSAGGSTSKSLAPEAAKRGCVVIDNSSAFRMDADVPLVVPEVNGDAAFAHSGIIANPNCSTIQMVVALKPLQELAGIQRVVVSTYQSISGAGRKTTEAMVTDSHMELHGKPQTDEVFPRPMAFNVLPMIPHAGGVEENGYTTEEIKMMNETRKILGDDSIQVSATCVRVPVLRGHSEAINVELRREVSREEIVTAMAGQDGLVLAEDAAEFATAKETADTDPVYVGRLRKDPSHPTTWDFWCVADNLLKGAALNAVQIAELLVNAKV
jgi:aspartate-semialdehyde dehydrogenase